MPQSNNHAATGAIGRPLLFAIAAGLLAALTTLYLLWGGRAAAQVGPALPARPNFVVIQTDDQTLEQLYAAYQPYPGAPAIRAMPNTLDLIAKRGVTFNHYYVSYSLCGPSRASLLTGRYAHNDEDPGNIEPDGGYSGFRSAPGWNHNIAIWLQADGYRTIHIGKFLNGYGEPPYSPRRKCHPDGAPGRPSSTPIRTTTSTAMN